MSSIFGRMSTAILKYPSGRFGLVGSVPAELTEDRGRGVVSKVWATEQDAVDALLSIGCRKFQLSDCSWYANPIMAFAEELNAAPKVAEAPFALTTEVVKPKPEGQASLFVGALLALSLSAACANPVGPTPSPSRDDIAITFPVSVIPPSSPTPSAPPSSTVPAPVVPILAPYVASLAWHANPGTPVREVTFHAAVNRPTAQVWWYLDGLAIEQTPTGTNNRYDVTYTYPGPGVYVVKVVVTDFAGNQTAGWATVVI